jgi:carbohydrate-binding DOMON domain-containing protein
MSVLTLVSIVAGALADIGACAVCVLRLYAMRAHRGRHVTSGGRVGGVRVASDRSLSKHYVTSPIDTVVSIAKRNLAATLRVRGISKDGVQEPDRSRLVQR